MRNYFGDAQRATNRMIERLDAQRTVPNQLQPAYLKLVHDELASFLPNFISCEAGEYWFDTILGRHDCQFNVGTKVRVMMVTFDRDERSSNKFVVSPAWFETDGQNNPVSVNGHKVRQAYQAWLRNKSQTAQVVTSSVPRRKGVLLKGGC